jgi:pilus assembly protein CpaB
VRTSNVVILFIAIVMGIIAAVLARTWLQSQQHASTATGTIVVATAPIGFGATISDDKISEIPWAAKSMPEGAFATKQQMLKDGRRVALTPIERGEPVLRAKITAPGQRGSLSTLLDEGKRAVTVRVDDVRGVAGFILPGDRVDVVLIRTEAVASGQSYSELILQNVKVLAVDQLAGQQPDQATVVAKAVTIEATAEEAQKVLLATNIGRLSLILRQPGEAHSAAGRRITERDLSNMPAPPPAPPPTLPRPPKKETAAPAPPPVQHSETVRVVVLHGLKREEYNVRRY